MTGKRSTRSNVTEHFTELMKNPEFRAEYALLELADSLAQQIRTLRERKHLSQIDLANLLGTKQSQVSRLENPLYARYSLLTLARVADALDCKLDVKLVPERSEKSTHYKAN